MVVKTVCPVPLQIIGMGMCESVILWCPKQRNDTPPPPLTKPGLPSLRGWGWSGPCFPLLSDLVSASWELQNPGSASLKQEKMSQEFAIYPPASQARSAAVIKVLMALSLVLWSCSSHRLIPDRPHLPLPVRSALQFFSPVQSLSRVQLFVTP